MQERRPNAADHPTAPLDRVERVLWIGLLLLVPISASPLLPFGAGTLVRPLSFVPALLLLALAMFRAGVLRQRPMLPRDAGWLLGLFTAYVVLGGLIVLLNQPDQAFKGQTPIDSFLRALLTLAVGWVFYTVARLQIRSAQDLRLTLRFLFIGLAASITFAVVQLVAILQRGAMLQAVQTLTDIFAVRTDGLVNRAQGLSLEPSWLATQIILLMLPALVARLISRQPGPGRGVSRGTLIATLAGFAVALTGLLAAGSRFGLVGAALMLFLAVVMALWSGRLAIVLAVATVLVAGGGGIALIRNLGAGAGSAYVLDPVSFVTTQLADPGDTPANADVTQVSDLLAIGGRLAANQTAFNLWLDHPLGGVSLGNNYRYFARYAPDWAFGAGFFTSGRMEGAGWVDPNAPEKGNAKNFFLRLLSETGLIGFALFLAFLWRQLYASPGRDPYFIAFRLAAAAALVFSFFNQDSFADPAVWIVVVLCAAMGRLQAAPLNSRPEPAGSAAPAAG